MYHETSGKEDASENCALPLKVSVDGPRELEHNGRKYDEIGASHPVKVVEPE